MTAVLLSTLVAGSIYSCLALGLVLIFRGTGVLNFAHGEAVAVGAFIAYVVIASGGGWPLAISAAALAGLLLGVAIQGGVISQLRKASHLELVVATLALASLIRGILRWRFGSEPYVVPPAVEGVVLRVGGAVLEGQQLIVIVFGALIATAAWVVLIRTRAGLRIRACAADPTISSILGVRTTRVYLGVWGVALGAAAVGGALTAPLVFVTPDSGFSPLLFGVIGAVLGGFGSFAGAVVGGYAVALILALTTYLGYSSWQNTSVFLVLALVLLVRPDGIFGRTTRERV